MKKRLWAVDVETTLYVMAKTKEKAENMANEILTSDESFEVWARDPPQRINEVEADWRDSIPYGSDDNLTVAQILAKEKE